MILFTLPLIGALIGWLTNYLAIKMLFHPRRSMKLFFLSIHGVFPKRQRAFAHKLGEIVSTELISAAEVTEHLKEYATSEESLALVSAKIEAAITARLPRAFPMAAMFMTNELIAKIRTALADDLRELVTALIDQLSDRLEEELDIHGVVEEKVAAFSSDKLEEILFAIMRREFKFIELVGAVLGFLIGLCQVGLLQLAR